MDDKHFERIEIFLFSSNENIHSKNIDFSSSFPFNFKDLIDFNYLITYKKYR